MNTPIGTDITAVTSARYSVPWMACAAPPPTRRGVIPACELVHHCDSSSIWPPLMMVAPRIHTSGTTATKKATHMTTRASRSLVAREADFDASSGRCGRAGGAVGVVSSCTVLIRRRPSCAR